MINVLVVVGNNIKYNKIFMAYLERKVEEKVGYIDAVYHLDKNDSELFLTLEEIIASSHNVVIATRDAYALVGKILCTLTKDSMTLKEDILAPAKASKIYHDSYLLGFGGSLINVLKIKEQEMLPPVMIECKRNSVDFFLVDAESAWDLEQLENIIKVNDVKMRITQLIQGLSAVHVYDFKHAQYDGFMQAIAFGFRDKVLFGSDLSSIIAKRLIESDTKVTCAESCTGGLIASEIVKNSGVSAIFNGSIVSYANTIKIKALGVKSSTLKEHGAVSVQTVYEMLEGALKTMDAEMAIAVSGIAGPTGGSEEKPVGTVYIGAKSKEGETLVEKLLLKGDRMYIQQQALFWGLKLLLLSDKKLFFNFLPKTLDN